MSNYLLDLINCKQCRLIALIVILFVPAVVRAQETASTGDGSPASADKSKTTTDTVESKKIADNFKYRFEVGGQFVDVKGARPSKFEEFGRIREGFAFRRFRIASNPGNSPGFFRAIGRSAGEIDQQYFVDFGRYGTFRTTFQYDGSPHLF